MTSAKYKNGLYKSTSKSQENKAQKLFKDFKAESMGFDLNQKSGNLNINIVNKSNEYYFLLSRKGKIINSKLNGESTMKKAYNKPLVETDTIKIFGNNHDKMILNGSELSQKYDKILLNDFDYLNNSDSEDETDILESIKENFSGFLYKNELYSLSQFMKIDYKDDSNLTGYHGILNLSAFSGLLIKLDDMGESLKAYYYYNK